MYSIVEIIGNCRTRIEDATCVSSESQKEMRKRMELKECMNK